MNLEHELEISTQLANRAGDILLTYFHDRQYESSKKRERDIVTTADTASEEFLIHGLAKAFPGDCVIAEEGGKVVADRSRTWYVDPLDGTKEFIKKNGEFTVNIALIKNGTPVMGVVYVPVTGVVYVASGTKGSFSFNTNNNNSKI